MTQNEDQYSKILNIFDDFKLDDILVRRYACKPLWDYFQKIILEVGVDFCDLDSNSLKISHLKTRWENIKYCLEYVDDPKIWDNTINEMHNIRSKVEHNDEYYPKKDRLLELRTRAPEFKDWIIRTTGEYYKQSNDFTLKEGYYHLSNRYIDIAKSIIHEYGSDPPHTAKLDYLNEPDKYSQIPELMETLKARLKKIAKLEDIERLDLENLIKIVEIVSDFNGKEYVLLSFSVCPKCGGKIEDTDQYFGETEYDPEPDGLVYRVGCEKCDYELHSEIIYI